MGHEKSPQPGKCPRRNHLERHKPRMRLGNQSCMVQRGSRTGCNLHRTNLRLGSSVAATRLEVGLIAVVGRFHNRLSRLNRGNRSAPVVATRLESQLRVDQSWIPAFPTPAPLPSQLHNIPVVAYFYPEIEIHLHGLVLRCNDNGRPTPFAVRLSQTSPQPWIGLARVPETAYASR